MTTAPATQSRPVEVGVNRIDHYVMQVNDLWRAFEFYRDVLGAKLLSIAGADVERLSHRGNQIVFMGIAGHKGIGASVSNVEVPPAKRICEHFAPAFEFHERDLDRLNELLAARGMGTGYREYGDSAPLNRSIFFQDPDGHTIEACTRTHAGQAAQQDGHSVTTAPLRISHVRLEVSDVHASTRWFHDVLGFEAHHEHEDGMYLKVQDGDQFLVLRPAVELSAWRDFVRGPHIDLVVPPAAYPAIFERITTREGYWDDAPHPFEGPRGVNYGLTVYFVDPDGNRFQVSPAGSH